MKCLFHPEAEEELSDAAEYYERQRTGLGLRLHEEIDAAIRRICSHPCAWEKMDAQTHRCLTGRFPYGIVYRIKGDHIRIIAIAHLRRKPTYWKHR